MPVIEVDGDFEKAVRKFNREVERTGILIEIRRETECCTEKEVAEA